MSSSATTSATASLKAAGSRSARPPQKDRAPMRVATLLLITTAALALAWLATRALGLTATSRTGYWLGVVGGCAMLVIFLYPLRKRFAFMRSWGPAKPWFVVHMTCGIVGPLVVLVHSGFHIGSINAGVAMVCMLLVAGSGIIGRFVYVRIHHGLTGAHWTLAELQALIGASDAQVRSRLAFAPRVEERLHSLQAQLVQPQAGALARIGLFLGAPAHALAARLRCRRDLTIALKARSAAVSWSSSQYRRALAKSQALVDEYVEAVQRAAQLSAYERIFSWWHILHVPLVWLLVVSAIAHVVAVHAY